MEGEQKREVILLSKAQKKAMKADLQVFRNKNEDVSVRVRLIAIPFTYASEFFNFLGNSPCAAFGRQLVLKIVDELLD